MKLKQVVAGAAIGCTLSMTGISLGSGVASAAPRARACNVAAPVVRAAARVVPADLRRSMDPAVRAAVPVVQADLRRSVDPGVQEVPAVVREVQEAQAVPATSADRAVHPMTADPAAQAVPATSADRAVPATSADPAAQAVAATSADRAVPTSEGPTTMTSAGPTTTIGGRRGTQGTTTGAVGSTVPRGVTGRRPGAGVHRRRLRGTDRCRKHGGLRRRQSTTGASTSNPCGTRVTTNGVSTSSGSGFRCRSDLPTGRPPRVIEAAVSVGQFTRNLVYGLVIQQRHSPDAVFQHSAIEHIAGS